MKRILIVGTSGCGKTTLATELGKLLNIKVIDLDNYYWLPNWHSRSREEFRAIVIALTEGSNWVVSGNYSVVQDILIQSCDTIIWLDYSFLRCFLQAFKRSVRRAMYKEQCCGNNYESFYKLFFSSESILLWIVRTYGKRKALYNDIFNNQVVGKEYLRFTNFDNKNIWLDEVKRYPG